MLSLTHLWMQLFGLFSGSQCLGIWMHYANVKRKRWRAGGGKELLM